MEVTCKFQPGFRSSPAPSVNSKYQYSNYNSNYQPPYDNEIAKTFIYGMTLSTKITNPIEYIGSIEGSHDLFESIEKHKNLIVQWIRFENSVVDYFPKGIPKLFPSLSSLSISDCNLEEISKTDLNGLKFLTTLSITRCKLKNLPDDLFVGNVNLRTVDLSSNKIELKSSKFLEPFLPRNGNRTYLLLFDLSKNTNIDAFFDNNHARPESFEEFKKLIDEKCKKPAISEEDKQEQKTPNSKRSDKQLLTFDNNIKNLWTSRQFSDFNVVAATRSFRVHRLVIASRSPKLKKFFDDNEDATEIKIQDFNENVVENLLQFMYTGEVKEDESDIEMFSIAAKLEVSELKSIYEQKLEEKLKTSDEQAAYEIFILAHQNSSAELKLLAFEMIEKLFAKTLSKELLNNPKLLKNLIDKKLELEKVMKTLFV